jgi:hypothetical protein
MKEIEVREGMNKIETRVKKETERGNKRKDDALL